MRKLFGALFILGLLVVLGSAGACDIEYITFRQAILQSIVGLAFQIIGFMGFVVEG